MLTDVEGEECKLTPDLELALMRMNHSAFDNLDASYDVLAPARCRSHQSESPLECGQINAHWTQTMHILRCHAHNSESPLECLARGPLPVRMDAFWRVPDV